MARRRKLLLFSVVSGGLVLVLAAQAFACVTFAGFMELCNADGECITAFGEAEPSRHTIRAGQRSPALGPENRALNSFSAGVGPSLANGASITIRVGASSPDNRLPAGTYNVNLIDLTAYDLPIPDFETVKHHAKRGCIVAGGPVRTIGTLVVDGHGNGSGTYVVPGDAVPTTEGQAAVCVAMPQTIYANQAPILLA